MTVPAGFATMPKSYDDQGFQIFPTATAAPGSGSDSGSSASDSELGILSTADEEGDAPLNLPRGPIILGSVGAGLVTALVFLVW